MYELVQSVERRFERLCSRADSDSLPTEELRRDLEDAKDKFRLWTGISGALRRNGDKRSLSHRVREAPDVGRRFSDVLEKLDTQLGTVCTNERSAQRSDASFRKKRIVDEEDAELLGDLLSMTTSLDIQVVTAICGISDTVTRLYKLTHYSSQATTTDQYAKAEAKKGKSPYEFYDIKHVKDKYRGSTAEPWLLERLGRAISKRRQYLEYRQEHHDKLQSMRNAISEDTMESVERGEDSRSRSHFEKDVLEHESPRTLIYSPSTKLTAATTVRPELFDEVDDGLDDCSTMASSYAGTSEPQSLAVPDLDDFASPGAYFLCPYCCTTQKFNGQMGWRHHVLRDLRPFICTFNECGLLMFKSRRDWFDHEMLLHRRRWVCKLCAVTAVTRDALLSHIEISHINGKSEQYLDLIADAGSAPQEQVPAASCPLCNWRDLLQSKNNHLDKTAGITTTPSKFARHLGSHMIQLALFALPRGQDAEEPEADGRVSASSRQDSGEESDHSTSVGGVSSSSAEKPLAEGHFTSYKQEPRNAATDPIYHCVYHGSSNHTTFESCITHWRYLSHLRRHHEQKHSFFYCTKCFEVFAKASDRKSHGDCLPTCVTKGCPAMGSRDIPLPCSHVTSQRDTWRHLFMVARPGEQVPEPGEDALSTNDEPIGKHQLGDTFTSHVGLHTFADDENSDRASQTGFLRQKRRRDIKPEAKYRCVYHGSAVHETTTECALRKIYVSQLHRHHERHDLYYCHRCFEMLSTSEQKCSHTQAMSCLPICVTQGCHNWGSRSSQSQTPCSHKSSQRDIWRYLFMLARPGDQVPDPDQDVVLADDSGPLGYARASHISPPKEHNRPPDTGVPGVDDEGSQRRGGSAPPSATVHICLHEGCGKDFATRSQLQHHERSHKEPAHFCDECQKGFHFRQELDRHLKSKFHNPDKGGQHKCNVPDCKLFNEGWARPLNWKRHMERVHGLTVPPRVPSGGVKKSDRRRQLARDRATPSTNADDGSASPTPSSIVRSQNDGLGEALLEEGDDETIYCYCKKFSFGDMVSCDNDNCQHQWFHYKCVGVTEEPDGEWLCPTCRVLPRSESHLLSVRHPEPDVPGLSQMPHQIDEGDAEASTSRLEDDPPPVTRPGQTKAAKTKNSTDKKKKKKKKKKKTTNNNKRRTINRPKTMAKGGSRLRGYWMCHECKAALNPLHCPDRCPTCKHFKCPSCRTYP